MALVEVSYPVTGLEGEYKNVFPSQIPITFDLKRTDAVIDTISSGTDGVVRIEITGTFGDIAVGNYVSWGSNTYGVLSSKVLTVVSTSVIEVDFLFSSTDATNGFVNYHQNYFVEIRYVLPSSSSNDQTATLLINDYSQVPNSPNGNVSAIINAPNQLLVPDFDLTSSENEGLYIEFKIQYRESYDGNRSASWVSPTPDVKIMLVHASEVFQIDKFSDESITKRYARFYPLVYSLVYSNVNDSGLNEIQITATELALDQSEIQTTTLATLLNFNGVFIGAVDTNGFDGNTAFVTFNHKISSSTAQFDPTQFDPTQFA